MVPSVGQGDITLWSNSCIELARTLRPSNIRAASPLWRSDLPHPHDQAASVVTWELKSPARHSGISVRYVRHDGSSALANLS